MAGSWAGLPSALCPTAAATAASWRAPCTSPRLARGGGVGQRLLEELIASTEAAGIWTIEAGMFPENESSIRLHEPVGFEIVGRRKRLGKLDGKWRDVLLLERRSETVN